MDRNYLMTRKYDLSRRLLAVFCVICIAVLQCFVILPAVTEEVYADSSVYFMAEYSNDMVVGTSNSSWITKASASDVDIDTGEVDPDDNPITVHAKKRPLSDVLKNAKLSDDRGSVKVNDSEVSVGSTYLVKFSDSDDWFLYEDGMLYDDVVSNPVDSVRVKLNKNPVTFSKKPTPDKKKPRVGDTVTISYKLSVDKFYENSDEYDSSEATELTWSGGKKVKISGSPTSGKSGSITVKVLKSGDITITAKGEGDFSYLSSEVSFSGKKQTLKVTPKSISMEVMGFKTCTVKYNGSVISNASCTWTSSDSSVASVTSGSIRGVKEGKVTITVKYNNLTAKVNVTVKARKTSSYSYSRSSYSGYRPSYSSYRPTTGTGATRMTTATRPLTTETAATTSAPSFQTMTVKEVYLTPLEEDPFYDEGDPGGDEWDDENWDDEDSDDEDYDEDGVSFPAAAGSAAVAAAACGAGAVGRVRKFRSDMGGALIAGAAKAAGDGKRKFGGKKNAAEEITDTVKPETTEGEPKAEEGKKAKGLRGKFRKK